MTPRSSMVFSRNPIIERSRLRAVVSLLLAASATAHLRAADYTPGAQHVYTHESGDVPEDTYQYSVWVPESYDPKRAYPVVFFLHGGDEGRMHPDLGKRNMISARLVDNRPYTDAGYSGNAHGYFGYVHVAPVKAIARWNAGKFRRLLDHVKSKVSIDENRVSVTGFSMGGQGTWIVGSSGARIAAMMPLGAWGCDEVPRGTTPDTCMTTKTPVWVLHCPLDDVSKISEQVRLFQNHIDCGGYGRFTMIPGEGHLDRPPGEDSQALSMRVAWMLSQTHGTPFNYLVQVNGGVVFEVVSGDRAFLGDTSRYGFFEPGSVIRVTAPETRDGEPFVKWASVRGSFADPSSRRTAYTTAAGDAELMPIYAGSGKLTVVGGTPEPAQPEPGDVVTVTADADGDLERFFYWTADGQIDIAHPHRRSVTFCMPSGDLTLTARVRGADRE